MSIKWVKEEKETEGKERKKGASRRVIMRRKPGLGQQSLDKGSLPSL